MCIFTKSYGSFDEDDTNVNTWGNYTGAKNQQFFIYYIYVAYYFRPLHTSTKLLDISSEDNHNLELWTGGENWAPQEFNINNISENDIGKHLYTKEIINNGNKIIVKYICEKCGNIFIEQEYNVADTNLDGNINIRDVTSIQRHVSEYQLLTDEQLTLADINGDGVVDINDATHLQRYFAEFEGIVLGKQV